jgi:hypothetical protein
MAAAAVPAAAVTEATAGSALIFIDPTEQKI